MKKGKGWRLTCGVLLLWNVMMVAVSCGSCGCTLVILVVTHVRASKILSEFVIYRADEGSSYTSYGAIGLCADRCLLSSLRCEWLGGC